MSQDDLMALDNCVVVNENDQILGACSKRDAHIFDHENVNCVASLLYALMHSTL